MKRVIERCPNCGVEHDDPQGGACEVCGTELRFWCRTHSREIGWLDSAQCPRCAAEAVTWRPRPSAPPPAAAPPPAPAPPRREPPREPAPPPRVPPREPAPPPSWRTRIRTRSAPPPPPPDWRGEPEPSRYPEPAPYPGRDPRDVMRERMEDLGPVLETGATVASRLFRGVFAIVRNVLGWGIIGALLAAAVGYYENADIMWFAMFGAMVGAGIGLLFGFISALRILFAPRRRRMPRGR